MARGKSHYRPAVKQNAKAEAIKRLRELRKALQKAYSIVDDVTTVDVEYDLALNIEATRSHEVLSALNMLEDAASRAEEEIDRLEERVSDLIDAVEELPDAPKGWTKLPEAERFILGIVANNGGSMYMQAIASELAEYLNVANGQVSKAVAHLVKAKMLIPPKKQGSTKYMIPSHEIQDWARAAWVGEY